MADQHLQINTNGTTELKKTILWPNKKVEQELVIKSLFERNNWIIDSIKNENGSFWKIIVSNLEETKKINLYISSIRDELRKNDEFKMQLGSYYPTNSELGWDTIVLGIYVIEEGQYILAGYDTRGYDLSTNPSLRGTRTSGLQKALMWGLYKYDKCVMFKPDFLYYYINNIDSIFGKFSSEINNNSLKEDLQVIFYGAPGTGKSHKIKDDANVKIADEKNLVFRTTFHPDSDYSTFVGCYKPTKEPSLQKQPILDYDSLVDKLKEYLATEPVNITRSCALFGCDYHDSIVKMQESGWHTIPNLVADAYKSGTTYDSTVRAGMNIYESGTKTQGTSSSITYTFVPQAFLQAYVAAWNNPDENVYLVIEEINRGNCAQIFGDLFQLLDRDDNGESEYPIMADRDLAKYLSGKDEDGIDVLTNKEGIKDGKLKLPKNLYIWATMNTSDQSLFPIDSAFKRRWDWEYMPIGYKNDTWTIKIGTKEYKWVDFQRKINEKIYDVDNSEDKQLGDYFVNADRTGNKISADTLLNKILFYLWNDVCKDDPDIIFKWVDDKDNNKEKSIKFSEFFCEKAEKERKLQGFMAFLEIKVDGDDDKKVEQNDDTTDGNDDVVNS